MIGGRLLGASFVLGIMDTSMYSYSKGLQQRVVLELFLNLATQLSAELIRPTSLGEELVSQELGACWSVIWIQTKRPLKQDKETHTGRTRVM